MKFLETSNSLTEADIVGIEENLQIKFSEDFKKHYLEYNGGYPENDKYSCKNNDTITLNTFLL